MSQNPLLSPFNTPFETIPFLSIKPEHYEPAIKEAIIEHNKEIENIINEKEEPSFKNTIVALENSGRTLNRITSIFFNLLSAETNDKMDKLAENLMPILSEHENNISLNEKLFKRIKNVYLNKPSLNLNTEDSMLLEKSYDSFIRNGANLSTEKKKKFRELSLKLSTLTLRFSQNRLKEINNFELIIDNEENLKGIPQGIIDAAKEVAKEKGYENAYVFTLHAPSFIPFMKYSSIRELRKKMFIAYNTQCIHDNQYNNVEIVKELVNIRLEIANLLGYETYADYVLKKRMAKTQKDVYDLLYKLLDAYTPTAQKEVKEVENFAKLIEGKDFTLMPWDWAYYSEKLKNKKFDFNEEELRPYFEINNVIKGIFGLATKLYGITFKENKDIQTYNKDVKTFEINDSNNNFLAVLYADFFPRKGKQSGAWMTSYKEQWKENGKDSRPSVSINMNFTKPTDKTPSLLTFSEVTTFLHEFGHALHGVFANTTYQSMSGTNVYWDFVELPSQIMENFATENQFLNTFAKHYKSGEQLPAEFINKIVDSSNFNIGYACLRQISFGLLDMAWYTREEKFEGDVTDFEKKIFDKTRLLPYVDGCCMTVQFSHIMSGGYSAGYYSYKWAEVLDADAFARFKNNGIFDKKTAQSFRENILSKGGTEHPMDLYLKFKGEEPTIDALLKRNGITN